MTPLEGVAESQLILILDDEETITTALTAGLERPDRTLITCNDVESAELIVERLHPSHILADVRISGPFGYEGLDFIRFAKLHAPQSGIILMSGDAPAALQREAFERGASLFLQKPLMIEQIDAAIDAELGITVVTTGIRDIILPGDMKDLMNRVTEARKAAEASLITRVRRPRPCACRPTRPRSSSPARR